MQLSLVIPTYNEAGNVRQLAERIAAALAGKAYELIFVDDSTDGTDQVIAALAREDSRLRLLHRPGRRGLATAVVDGLALARGDVVGVLDADLQHPPEVLPTLLEALERSGADVAVASRYVPGGSYDTFSWARRLTSRVATLLARLLLHRARPVADPLSGFFVVRRAVLDNVRLSPVGYKILLEVLVRGRIGRVVEVPYRFQARQAGQSKLTWRQHRDYLRHLARLVRVHPQDLRFVRFALVGASGVGVNMGIFGALTARGAHHLAAGVAAVASATTWNFLWNDAVTWADARPQLGSSPVARYLRYWAVTGVGSVLYLAVLGTLVAAGVWPALANLAGIAAAVLWNFRANDRWTWKSSRAGLARVVYVPSAVAAADPPPEEVLTSTASADLTEAAYARRRTFVRYLKDGPPAPVRRSLGMRASDSPPLSIIVPVAGSARAAHLRQLLRQLEEQTFQDFEVLQVLGDRRQGRAINAAAAVARGEILLTFDDDTRLGNRELLERIMGAFRDPTVGIAGVANLVPSDAPWIVRRAMREIPRRSSRAVAAVVDSDMAEHPCLAIRRDLFYAVGGEHEWIPRGLDPYLRREVRRLGYRVVVIPGAWIHHLLPSRPADLLRQYFRNGLGAAYVRKFYPQFVIDQALDHGQPPRQRPWGVRAAAYAWRAVVALVTVRWIYLGTLAAYAVGYVRGLWGLREDSL